MSFNLDEHNEAIEKFANYLKEEFNVVYGMYDRQEQDEIYQVFLSAQEGLNGLSSETQTKIVEFTKRFVPLSKSRCFFLKNIEIKNNSVDLVITTNIIDLTHENHKAFLEMMNICDNTDMDIGTGDSVAITIIFTIKGE